MKLSRDLRLVARTIRVLRDRVLIAPLPYEHPILVVPGMEVQKGVVVAVGYGRRSRRKVRFDRMEGHLNTQRAMYFEDGEETGAIKPMRVKQGDVVEFSPRNITKVDFSKLGFNVGELLFIWQEAIMTVDPTESLHESLLWQQSAGYDRQGNFMSGAESWNRPA